MNLSIIAKYYKFFLYCTQRTFGLLPKNPFIYEPSRLFQIPSLKALTQIELILTSLNYKIIEKTTQNPDLFILSCETDPLSHVPDLKILLKGERSKEEHWRVRIQLNPDCKNYGLNFRNIDLVMENMMRALGWQNYWIIELMAPLP